VTHQTDASEKGTWVSLFHPPVETKLMRGFEGLDAGDQVRVELVGTDLERGATFSTEKTLRDK
jgi:exoribonuclease-2